MTLETSSLTGTVPEKRNIEAILATLPQSDLLALARLRITYHFKEKPMTHLNRAILKQKAKSARRKDCPESGLAKAITQEFKPKKAKKSLKEPTATFPAVWRSFNHTPKPPLNPAPRSIQPPISLAAPKSPKALLDALKSRGIEIEINLEDEGGRMVPRFQARGGVMFSGDWVALRRWESQITDLLRSPF